MTYFDRALLAVTIIGALSGIVGSFIVLRRRVLFAQALTHATFPGAVVAALLGLNIQVGAIAACVSIIILLTLIGRLPRRGVQAATGVVLAGGFAAGVMLQALNPTAPIQVDAYLFGSVLSTTTTDLWISGVALAVTVVFMLAAGKQLLFSIFDPAGYRGAGYDSSVMDAILLVLTTLTVVTAMPAVGAILAIALIAGPAAAARLITKSVTAMVIVAPAIGVFSGLVGLFISRAFEVSAGASITLVVALVFVVCLAVSSWVTSRQRFRPKAAGENLDTGLIRIQAGAHS
jgi:manganese/iron transport system permease protein